MRRFNVVVSDEAGNVLDRYKHKHELNSLDDALDKLLKEIQDNDNDKLF